MNLHTEMHFPIIPVVAFVAGALLFALVAKEPFKEIGKALIWTGALVALLASQGSC